MPKTEDEKKTPNSPERRLKRKLNTIVAPAIEETMYTEFDSSIALPICVWICCYGCFSLIISYFSIV